MILEVIRLALPFKPFEHLVELPLKIGALGAVAAQVQCSLVGLRGNLTLYNVH
jgi:hypothetical protein